MNAIEQQTEVSKYILPIYPTFPKYNLILYLNRKLVNFNLKWIWIYGLEPHLPPLTSQKNKMLIFGLCSTSDDWPGWSMDLNPIHHPSPAEKIKCLFLDYVQLLVIGRAGRTQTPSTFTPLQPKNEMLIFGLRSTSDDWLGWSMDLNPIKKCHPSTAKKIKCSFLDYVQLLMISQAVDGLEPCLPPLSSQEKQKKMKCSFLDYVQLLMISQAVDGLEPHLPPLSSQKNEMLIFGLHSTFDDRLSDPSDEQ